MIEISDVSKYYGKIPVLKDIRLSLKPQQLIAFIGPNGAGKSTLLSMMGRLLLPDEGTIQIGGVALPTFSSKAFAQKLAILKQSNHTLMNITIRELVSFGRFPHSGGKLTEEDEAHIDQALHLLGLEGIQDQRIHHLSGGQLQRAYIALCVAQDTDYVLLDEPLNNLDMNYVVQMMQLLRELVDVHQKTVCFVVHDINIAAAYADEMVAMKEGKIFLQGPPEAVMKKEVLDRLYDMNVRVCDLAGSPFCLYFEPKKTRRCAECAHDGYKEEEDEAHT